MSITPTLAPAPVLPSCCHRSAPDAATPSEVMDIGTARSGLRTSRTPGAPASRTSDEAGTAARSRPATAPVTTPPLAAMARRSAA